MKRRRGTRDTELERGLKLRRSWRISELEVELGRQNAQRTPRSGLEIRTQYNNDMSQRVFGYDHFGNNTDVAISDEMKAFLDSKVLGGRVGDDFDATFKAQIGSLETKIAESRNAEGRSLRAAILALFFSLNSCANGRL